jgi:hypothetical protein
MKNLLKVLVMLFISMGASERMISYEIVGSIYSFSGVP